jgi:hypothetical protein
MSVKARAVPAAYTTQGVNDSRKALGFHPPWLLVEQNLSPHRRHQKLQFATEIPTDAIYLSRILF